MAIGVIFLIVACICFFVKGAGVNTGQIDLMNVGFGFVCLAVIAGV